MSGKIEVLRPPSLRPGWGFLLLLIVRPSGLSAQEPLVIDLPPADWTLQEQQFSKIVSVRELAVGRLLVSDATEDFLYVVDYGSGNVLSVGTHGDGPGEYRDAGYLYALGGDSTLFTDPTTRRWLLVVGDRIVATIGAAQPLPKRLGSSLWGADRSGRVLAFEGFGSALEDRYPTTLRYPDADSVRILLTQPGVFRTESRLDTIAELGGQGRLGAKPTTIRVDGVGYFAVVTSPLASGGQAWLFRDGWIAVAHPDPYKVDWRTPEGRWILGPPLPVAAVPVNRREKCFALARYDYPEPCNLEISPGWPEYMPPFVMEVPWVTPGGTALRAAPNGMLLVKRTPMADSSGERYDLVDRRGALRGVILLGDDQIIVGHGRSSLFVVEKDEMDLLTLSRHPWPTELIGQ